MFLVLRWRKIKWWSLLALLVLITGITSAHGWTSFSEQERQEWKRKGDIIWEVNTGKKVIALTFDDGPDKTFTPQVLDILNKHKVSGTFFLVGEQIAKQPQLAKKIVKEGHEIANHTYTHPVLTSISLDDLLDEVLRTEKIITKATGKHSSLFRPPGGYFNRKMVNLLTTKGYKIILWSWTQDTKDWTNPGVSSIIKKVTDNAKNGAIVIFHDCGGDRTQTVKALPPIINDLEQKGYHFVTISELLRDFRPETASMAEPEVILTE